MYKIELISLPNWRTCPQGSTIDGARFRIMCVTNPRALREGYHNICRHRAPRLQQVRIDPWGFVLSFNQPPRQDRNQVLLRIQIGGRAGTNKLAPSPDPPFNLRQGPQIAATFHFQTSALNSFCQSPPFHQPCSPLSKFLH